MQRPLEPTYMGTPRRKTPWLRPHLHWWKSERSTSEGNLEREASESEEAPLQLCGSDRMREAQDANADMSRVAFWVQAGRKHDPKDMDAENQDMCGLCAMLVQWKKLQTREGVLYRRGKHGQHVVVPGS